MIRTQIYLPKELYEEVGLVAKRQKKPKAQVIREAIEEKMQEKRGNAGEALLRLAALGKKLNITGPTDLSSRIDEYLYEEKA